MENQPIAHRSLRLDALRGCAVLGMILAHAIFFFHNGSNTTLLSVERFFNTTVFTLFVFISGLAISRFMDSHAHIGRRHLAVFIFKRASLFYIAYAITAIVALLTTTPALTSAELMTKIPGALTMFAPPNFTEYLPLFILLTLSQFFLWEVFHFTRQSIFMTIITGGFAYALGILLFPLNLGPVLDPIKELFAGGGTALRFPLLFYLPVFLWGLWWQHFNDHVPQDKKAFHLRLGVIVAAVSTSIAGIIISFWYYIPILDPGTRWPPSVAYLTTGIAVATIFMSISPSLRWIGLMGERIIVYIGRDALDLWISHLLLLFLYRRFIGLQFGDSGTVSILTLLLLILSASLSSLTISNRVVFPLRFTLQGATRYRIRYLILSILAGLALVLSLNPPLLGGATYGNFMLSAPLTVQKRYPDSAQVHVSTNRTWYIRHNSQTSVVDITVKATSGTETILLNPDVVKITIVHTVNKLAATQEKDGTIHYSLPVSDLAPGEYPITADVDNGGAHIQSNTASIFISEPFLVAWTFDWEGWDASDATLQKLEEYGAKDSVHFTHFVNPRMFLPDVLTPTRRATLAEFLQKRQKTGDEIALHIHMQFDLVHAAGVTPRTTHPWGLLTNEGYDVPMTEYTPEEFRTILLFAKNLATASGMPNPQGFRAGGWFLNPQLLKILSEENFAYDSSGRDRPATGSFSTVPWDLAVGAQPYIPSGTNILEIPDNGVATSESTSLALLARARKLYPGGILSIPKTFVVVSHPQFASREFPKIPDVLTALIQESIFKDNGPVVFVTMSDIHNIWTSYLH